MLEPENIGFGALGPVLVCKGVDVIVRKIFRGLQKASSEVVSWLRVLRICSLYPGVTISGKTSIGANCEISADDGSTLLLHNCRIASDVKIRSCRKGKLVIRDPFIGWGTVIVACDHIEIDSGCWLAEYVVIRDQDHRFGNGLTLNDSGFVSQPISVGQNCWLGAKCTVLKGVKIEQNSVIAASAVVTSNVPASCVYGGIPAKSLVRNEKPESL